MSNRMQSQRTKSTALTQLEVPSVAYARTQSAQAPCQALLDGCCTLSAIPQRRLLGRASWQIPLSRYSRPLLRQHSALRSLEHLG